MMAMEKQMVMVVVAAVMAVLVAEADDTNDVFDPCSDAKVKRFDGFTFGLAFSTKDSFFFNQTQLSPCDRRLSLSSTNSQLAVFRPKVDEISLLTVNSTNFNPISNGGYMVAFAGRKYAARSTPVLVADGQHTITSFTLVLEFKKGTLQSFYWKKFGCSKCSKSSAFVCLNEQDCAVKSSHCKNQGGSIDCNISIQLIFSGTDKKLVALNSWYELKNLRQYSLYGLYSNIRDAIIDQYDNFF
ncbi:hypothetical protein VitviT2T_003443 [Vitis vinifera]|uniref:Expp1 protein n=2 Tax=Vitis vinifera TaxID=29760 RepID=A0ABY9BM87_VITVI|nr:uncharacterized protein LOC100243476 [Vitis vinifera]WJZ83794.1 hypothetical protein VitviT2T_003443 [Vitis vinifera]|eukprot:XP_002281560.2 PREDICTED: uncharacterized protein LOC100243476 [Vitis vinifera]